MILRDNKGPSVTLLGGPKHIESQITIGKPLVVSTKIHWKGKKNPKKTMKGHDTFMTFIFNVRKKIGS